MAADPDEMAFLMEAVGGVDGIQDWIGDWMDAEPESTLPVLVAGCHAVRWAWEARGGKRAKYTTAAQFKSFHERLHYACGLRRGGLGRLDPLPSWCDQRRRPRRLP